MSLEVYVESQREFYVDVYNALTSTGKTKNIMFSPYSLSNVLFTLHVGARGSNAKQIETCLEVVMIFISKTDLCRTPNEGEKKYALHKSNAIFADNREKLYEPHRSVLRRQILQIPYKYGASMYTILPSSQNDTMQTLMTADRLTNQIFAKAYKSEVNLWLPKLKIEFPLKEIMTKLNMTDMFEARKANLSELAEHLHVNDCIQKVVLDIDEEGTVAAAATTMSCGLLCSRPQPIDFKVDRPFLSMIRDDATGLDLFLGTVTDMST
uniref:Glia-derived nexin-like n=1 Tax=Saccoglossus kowalevskii TaxID=10224 RepID=A0ABM0MBT1_SACKO|nr:PREDICTED: glia-derived nexin-like [Saccoglossus kowalevskii]